MAGVCLSPLWCWAHDTRIVDLAQYRVYTYQIVLALFDFSHTLSIMHSTNAPRLGGQGLEIDMGTKTSSNIDGILLSRPHGGFRLAKQTMWGDEYIAFSYLIGDAWDKLSRITGRTVTELKRLPITRF